MRPRRHHVARRTGRGHRDVNGVRVRRIRSAAGRDEHFHPLWAQLRDDPAHAGPADMERWVDLQGPRSPALLEAVAASDADVLAFYPYLYYPTVRGLPLVAERAVLHPAAHEEPALHLPLFDDLFARCRGFAFHSRSERALVNARFGVAATPQVLIGLGVEEPAPADERRRATRCGPRSASADAPYVVCIGRVDDQKGTGMLWRFFRAFKERHPGPLRLVFVGQVVDPPEPADDIVVTGMIDDAAKWALLRGAGPGGTVAPRVVLPHGDRGTDRGRARSGERGVRRHAGALRAVGRRAVVRRLRRVRGDARPAHTDDAPAEIMRQQRAPLRGGQLHVAGGPGPLLLVPGALRGGGGRRADAVRAQAGGNGVP